MKRLTTYVCFALALFPSLTLAHSYKQGDISIGHVWARPTPEGASTAAIYFPLLNAGKEPDQLISVSTDIAKKVEIHETSNEDGVMKMKKLDALVLEPNKPIALRPRGIHLMVFGLQKQLKEGEKAPLTLQFEKAGTVQVEVAIESAGANTK